MIEIDSTLGDSFITIRKSGTLTQNEFIELAWTIAASTSDRALLLFFDWSAIERWPFVNPKADALAAWRTAAKDILGAAIVHERGLNPQAAWLGAVLREEGVVVRSWRPQQATSAAVWLLACKGSQV